MWVIEIVETWNGAVIDRIELREESQTTIIRELIDQFENLIDGCTLRIHLERDDDVPA